MDHYSSEGSNIRVHSRTMSRGCARITKPPYTPPRGTCLFVNLLIRLRVLKVDTSTFPYFASLSCVVHCLLLTPRVGVHLRRYIQTLGMIRSVIISLPLSFLKTATIPTYQGISIAFPSYIAMQLPPLHVIHVPATLAATYIAYIMIVTSSL